MTKPKIPHPYSRRNKIKQLTESEFKTTVRIFLKQICPDYEEYIFCDYKFSASFIEFPKTGFKISFFLKEDFSPENKEAIIIAGNGVLEEGLAKHCAVWIAASLGFISPFELEDYLNDRY